MEPRYWDKKKWETQAHMHTQQPQPLQHLQQPHHAHHAQHAQGESNMLFILIFQSDLFERTRHTQFFFDVCLQVQVFLRYPVGQGTW
jgi:hypothetical protein